MKELTKEQIIEAIRNASLDTFVGEHCMSTCMGWQQEYDAQGRPLRANPNYKDSSFIIEGIEYPVTRVGWSAYIWKPGTKTAMLSKDNETFDEFKARVYSCYPYQMGYMAQFSEFKEIF